MKGLAELLDRSEPVPESGCRIWDGKWINGYGRMSWKTEGWPSPYAHRSAWIIANQQSIPTGMCVCHHCDVGPCVNPSHLFLGTIRDNALDAKRKGRLASGDRSASRRPERRLAVSQFFKGRPNPKVAQALRGRRLPPEVKAKMSASLKCRPHSPEHISKQMKLWQSNTWKNKMSSVMKKLYLSPEMRAMASERAKIGWETRRKGKML